MRTEKTLSSLSRTGIRQVQEHRGGTGACAHVHAALCLGNQAQKICILYNITLMGVRPYAVCRCGELCSDAFAHPKSGANTTCVQTAFLRVRKKVKIERDA